MEQERALLERLERIDDLRRDEAPAAVLLGEVRALLAEAEDWVQSEPSAERAVAAIERSRRALETGERAAGAILATR